MTAIAMDISEAALKFTELIAGLKRDEEIVITADNKPVARLLVPEEQLETTSRRRAGLTEGYVWISPDFNEPMELVMTEQTNDQLSAKPKRRRAGTAEGEFWMSPDFD